MNARMSLLIAPTAVFLFSFCPPIVGYAEGSVEVDSGQMAEIPKVTVILQRIYLDGDMSEEIVIEKNLTVAQIQEKYQTWEFIEQQDNQLRYQELVDDISPLLKANGYFGITDKGILTIFNGKPKKAKIIHSFFQIDVEKLESREKRQLKKGIPIISKDNYHHVLETFKPYSKAN